MNEQHHHIGGKAARGRTRRRAVVLAALVSVSLAPTVARAAPEERVVHGRIGTPSGATVDLPRVSTGNTGVIVPHQTVHPRCVLSENGVQDTEWVIDHVRPGRVFELTADAGQWNADFDIEFYTSLAACQEMSPAPSIPYQNFSGDEHSRVPEGAEVARVTLVTGTPGAAFTYRELEKSKVKPAQGVVRRPTVVAVIEPSTGRGLPNGFSPYHFDVLGHQHPWNTDEDLENDFDFTDDPAGWLPGYPGAVPVQLTLPGPTEGNRSINELAGTVDANGKLSGGLDSAAWNAMKGSTATSVNLYRFPGTKVVGAVSFTPSPARAGSTYAENNAHGSKSASVAAGNTHGTCPECVFVHVLYTGTPYDAIEWVAKQPWIDVVTNSWVNSTYAEGPNAFAHRVTRPAVESGQTWAWAAGNGVEGTFVVPNQTYGWGLHGADWGVTVGGVSYPGDRTLHGGRSVDIVSYGTSYSSAGGTTANGHGGHAGTSNATPVVAGTFAKVIQWGRDLLGDTSPGHDNGVVAQGTPRPCDGAVGSCPLDDGLLTRVEVQSLVFQNVLPSTVRPPTGAKHHGPTPIIDEYVTTPSVFTATTQGHGIVHGRKDPGAFAAEQRRFLDVLRGAVSPMTRPPGEQSWMFADSRCRQRLWGAWSGGYYKNGAPDPTWDPTTDQLAMAWNAACTPLPNGIMALEAPKVEPICRLYPVLGRVCINPNLL